LKTRHVVLAVLLVAALVVLFFPYFYSAPVREYQPDLNRNYPVATQVPEPSLEPREYPDNTLGKMQQLYDTQQDEKLKEFCMNILLTNTDELVQWKDYDFSGTFKTGPAALLILAEIYWKQKNFDASLKYYQQLVDKYLNDEVISFDWGSCRRIAGAEGLDGQIRIYLNERPDYPKAFQLAKKLKETYRGKDYYCVVGGGGRDYSDVVWEYIVEYLITSKAPLALCESEYQAEMALTDDKSGLLLSLGFTLAELGYKERAIAVFEEVVAKYPESWSCGGVGQLMCSFTGLIAYEKLIDIYKSTPGSAAKLPKAKQGMKELYNRLLIVVKKNDDYGEGVYQELKRQEDEFKKYFQ
jgi:tetratricopeptide (TPR) repeat protein